MITHISISDSILVQKHIQYMYQINNELNTTRKTNLKLILNLSGMSFTGSLGTLLKRDTNCIKKKEIYNKRKSIEDEISAIGIKHKKKILDNFSFQWSEINKSLKSIKIKLYGVKPLIIDGASFPFKVQVIRDTLKGIHFG